MSAYLDASVMIPTLVREDSTDIVRRYFRRLRQQRLISDFAAAEVVSGLSRLVRMRQLTQPEAAGCLSDFDAWRAATTSTIEVHAADARLAYAYVRRFELMLRAPDALHLAICRRADARLVTLDRRLANVAPQLGIAVETPQADQGEGP